MLFRTGLVTGLATVTLVLGASQASAQAVGQIRGAPAIASYYAIGMCLDVRASDRAVLLWNCHGGSNQAFRFVSGNYGMISLGDQRCLTSGLTPGAPLTAQTCTNAPNQRWGFQANSTLRNESGWCADIERGGVAAGTRIIGWSCAGSVNQRWYPAVTAKSAYVGVQGQAALGGRGAGAFLVSPGFSGGNIVASGGGNIVASGGGNLIANDGASIVAGGAGNMIASRASRIVASGGGNIVAGGAGNLLPNNWSFFSGAGAGIVAGGAGN